MKAFIFRDKQNISYLYTHAKHRIVYLNNVLCLFVQQYLKNSSIDVCVPELAMIDEVQIKQNLIRFNFLLDRGFLKETKSEYITDVLPENIPNDLETITNICFEMTEKCNLSCVYCCYGDLYEQTGNRCGRNLDNRIAFCIIDEICKKTVIKRNISAKRIVTLGFYGGEPLLRFSQIKDIVLYAKAKENENLHFDFQMTTNGLLIDKYIDFLAENDCRVTISLDGDYISSSYRLTPNGINPYNRIYKNIQTIKEKYPSYFDSFITFNTVLHDKNSIVETTRYFYDNFKKTTTFSILVTQKVQKDKKSILNKLYKELHYDHNAIMEILPNKDYLQMNHEIRVCEAFFDKLLNRTKSSLSDLLCEYHYKEFPAASCLPFVNKLFVSADGKLHLCEHVGFNYSIGYVDWEHEKIMFDRNELAQKYSLYFKRMDMICKKCALKAFCTTCIFQSHFKCTPKDESILANKIQSSIELLKIKHKLEV